MITVLGNKTTGVANAKNFKRLQCYPIETVYNHVFRVGLMQVSGVADMRGCIDYFEAICSDVEQIITFDASNGDGTAYIKRDGQWEAQVFRAWRIPSIMNEAARNLLAATMDLRVPGSRCRLVAWWDGLSLNEKPAGVSIANEG